MSPRSQWLAVLAVLVAVSAAALRRPVQHRAVPKLVVVIAVDQMRADFVTRFRDLYSGGFRWLLENGTHFPNAAYRHSTTFTAAGHATIATGLHPSTHGIVGNSWREAGRGSVYCVADDRYETVGGSGEGRSPLTLKADTIGDLLKDRFESSRVYSFSGKDRSAILLAGRKADGAFWYEPDCDCMVSTSYYAPAPPAWLRRFNSAGPASAYAGRDWNRLFADAGLYERLSRADEYPGERGESVFPHGRAASGFEDTLRATPFADEIALAAATAALRAGAIGDDEEPDLLALGLSATDAIGHRFGPFSQEAMDNHLRLDRALGRFIAVVARTVGLQRTTFALSADHGVVPLVEHLQAAGIDAERFDAAPLWQEAERAAADCGAGPADETVEHAGGSQLYWDDAELERRGISISRASACLSEWLEAQRGVVAAYTAEQRASPEATADGALFRNSYFEGRSPDIQLHLRENFYPGGDSGTGHGSAHLYDRAVPVILAGAGIRRGESSAESGPEDIVPTLARLLGLEVPPEPDARVLDEAVAPQASRR